MAKELARELINAGVHFGHSVSRWNPKMAPFIFAKRGNIHIIDVKKTLKGLLIARKLLAEVVSSGKDVVFVGTKRQAQNALDCKDWSSWKLCKKMEHLRVRARSRRRDSNAKCER